VTRIELVVLVDQNDVTLGAAPKLAVHQSPGRLHRAFSVVLSDTGGRLLLQRRATHKYHFRGLWSNSCCGHPRPGEELVNAGRRRVREELGLDVTLKEAGVLRYSAYDTASGLYEEEIDRVLVGTDTRGVRPDPREVCEFAYLDFGAIRSWLRRSPSDFTPWFPQVLDIAELALPKQNRAKGP
jgi:isopentenyl-diphosphate delta-isomerase